MNRRGFAGTGPRSPATGRATRFSTGEEPRGSPDLVPSTTASTHSGDVRCAMCDVRCATCDVRRATCDVRRPRAPPESYRVIPYLKRGLIALAALLILLLLVSAARTAAFRPAPEAEPAAPPEALLDGYAERLAAAIRIPTVSDPDPERVDSGAFQSFHRHLEEHFPAVHQRLRREVVGLSLLFTWEGCDPALEPILLMGHLDVVPVEPGTERNWTHPPFSGSIDGRFLWGQGAIDDKPSVHRDRGARNGHPPAGARADAGPPRWRLPPAP